MNYIPIQAYQNYIDAHIAMGQLEENDIHCWLKDENTITIDPILTHALGGIKLMVAEPQVERAMEILHLQRQEVQKKHSCPQCGSSNVHFISSNRKASNWLSAITTFFLGSYAIAPEKVFHCFTCGFEYEIKDEDDVDKSL